MEKEPTQLTQDRLRQILNYNPDTGVFTWVEPRRGVQVGRECGRLSKQHGYRDIGIDMALYRAHRLAFLYMLGRWPQGDVDHVNQDKSDNRWVNLREATRAENSSNVEIGKRRNTSGFLGVVWEADRELWRAQIRIDGRKTNLGRFKVKEDAAVAHDKAALLAFGEFATLNFPERLNDYSADRDAASVRPIAETGKVQRREGWARKR